MSSLGSATPHVPSRFQVVAKFPEIVTPRTPGEIQLRIDPTTEYVKVVFELDDPLHVYHRRLPGRNVFELTQDRGLEAGMVSFRLGIKKMEAEGNRPIKVIFLSRDGAQMCEPLFWEVVLQEDGRLSGRAAEWYGTLRFVFSRFGLEPTRWRVGAVVMLVLAAAGTWGWVGLPESERKSWKIRAGYWPQEWPTVKGIWNDEFPKGDRLSGWEPHNSWEIVQGEGGANDGALVVRGEEWGAATRDLGSTRFYDFRATLKVTLPEGGETNLFLRGEPKTKSGYVLQIGRKEPGWLTAKMWLYRNGQKSEIDAIHRHKLQLNPQTSLPDVPGLEEAANKFTIQVSAVGYEFLVCANGPALSTNSFEILQPVFEDKDKAFAYGRIGFFQPSQTGNSKIEFIRASSKEGPDLCSPSGR